MSTDTLEFPALDADMVAKPAAELVDVADISGGKAIVKLNATEAGLAALRQDLAGKTYDLTTTKGDKAARDDRQRCVKLRSALESKRKELKAPALEFGKMIDAEAKRITDAVLLLEAPIDTAIKADEERRERERKERERIEGERVAKLQHGVATIRNYVQLAQAPGMTAERIGKGIAALEAMAFTEAWQEFTNQAAQARDESLASLRVLHAGAVEREAEAKRQAEESARLAAQKAELERQAAELAAQQQAQREAQAKAKAEAEAKEREEEAKWAHHKPRLITDQEAADTLAADRAAQEYTEGQGYQQVLKAEPATADATDRVDPADASPRVGAMGAGQAADAAPAGVTTGWPPGMLQDDSRGLSRALANTPGAVTLAREAAADIADTSPPTLKLGAICERLGFTMTAAFVTETLGVEWAATDKAARLYRESQFPLICARLQAHIGKVAADALATEA